MKTWREDCPHIAECGSEDECNARSADAATPEAQPTATKEADPMATKRKTKSDPLPPTHVEAMVSALAAELMMLADEQRQSLRADRFATFAKALADLRQLGAFPAVELLQKTALDELTVLARELHAARIASVSAPPKAPEATP